MPRGRSRASWEGNYLLRLAWPAAVLHDVPTPNTLSWSQILVLISPWYLFVQAIELKVCKPDRCQLLTCTSPCAHLAAQLRTSTEPMTSVRAASAHSPPQPPSTRTHTLPSVSPAAQHQKRVSGTGLVAQWLRYHL